MKAKVRVDHEQVVAAVNPMIFGQFIEHLGRCIYGGICDPGHPQSDKAGFRLDVIEKIKELNPPILRWPGGNFVSAYHWFDGVGPKDKRPRRQELAWGTVESNQFGTHEFIDLCRRINTEPYICVNLGWGTPEEAVNWLEYCNVKEGSHYAGLRKQNGATEPFGVKYWGLGNELYGTWQHGHCEAEEYAHKAAETAKMMKRLDDEVKFTWCGANNVDWDRRVLDYVYRKNYGLLADYFSLHRYDGCPTYYGTLLGAMDFEADIVALKGLINSIWKQYHPTKLPTIAVDEWNVWYRTLDEKPETSKYLRQGEGRLEELYNLRDAIYAGSALNMFIRHADRVTMANMAQMVNVIAPIYVTSKGSYYQPIFFPLKYYRQLHRPIAVSTHVRSDTLKITKEFEQSQVQKHADVVPGLWRAPGLRHGWQTHWQGKEFPLVDVAATRTHDGREMTISMVNRHDMEAIEVDMNLLDYAPRAARQVLISGPDPMGYMVIPSGPTVNDNDYNPEACTVMERAIEKISSRFTVEIPAHSIVILTLTS